MRILYGVCGEGFGHATQSLEIIRFLKKQGHEIKIIAYDQAHDFLKDYFPVYKVAGPHVFYNKKGEVNYKKTILKNVKVIPSNLKKRKSLNKIVKTFKPHICVTDDEPVTTYLSYINKLPLISISMINTFMHAEIKIPKKYKLSHFTAKVATKLLTPKTTHFVAISLKKLKTKKTNLTFIPPVILTEIQKAKPKEKNFILVYLSKNHSPLLEKLKQINEHFIIYGYNTNKQIQNLQFKTRETFLQDLKDCKAIISTAGFVLLAESLFLKKPFFAIPLTGHFEQHFNATFVKEKSIGDFAEKPTIPQLKNFLANLKTYKKNLPKYHLNSKKPFEIIEKILKQYHNQSNNN